jgi:hypothetical protein
VQPGRRPTRTEYACLRTGPDRLLSAWLPSWCKPTGLHNGPALAAASRLNMSLPAQVVPRALHVTSSVSYSEWCQRQTRAHRQASRSPLESDIQSVNVLAKLAQGSLGVCATCAAASCARRSQARSVRCDVSQSSASCARLHGQPKGPAVRWCSAASQACGRKQALLRGRQALSVLRAPRHQTSFWPALALLHQGGDLPGPARAPGGGCPARSRPRGARARSRCPAPCLPAGALCQLRLSVHTAGAALGL